MTLYVIVSKEPVENAFKIDDKFATELRSKLVEMELDTEIPINK